MNALMPEPADPPYPRARKRTFGSAQPLRQHMATDFHERIPHCGVPIGRSYRRAVEGTRRPERL